MFSDQLIRWVASIDAPGTAIDAYFETFQIHRHNLTSSFDRSRDTLANLVSFVEYWSQSRGDEQAVVFTTDFSADGSTNLSELAATLPPRTRLIALVRFHRLVQDDRVLVVGIPTDDPDEFAKRVGGHLARFVRMQPSGSVFKPTKTDFPDGRYEYATLDDFRPRPGDAGHTTIHADGMRYDFLMDLKTGSQLLIVFGQSALVRNSVQVPLFQRWSWAEDLPGASYIAVNDPNLYLDETLNAGWWFGTTTRDTAREFAGIVSRVAAELGLRPEQVVFTGGSAGGFSSFQMAACFPGSRVVVDIPQVDMRAYSHQNEAHHAARVAFGVPRIQEVPEELLHRVDATHRFFHEKHVPDYMYLQNLRDRTHILSQFRYFVDQTMQISHDHGWGAHTGEIELYSAWNLNRGGHFPLNRADTTDRIRRFMAWRGAPGSPPRQDRFPG
ncbi:hypothetical protein [Agrococcus sp. ARC_14]|uniref:hypothetical protein n=1 Tax=Agrococcus sp. ARC_14 TaxID=2919927 RepID=UPI001F054C28|nr:hypothetical protein [Agrococcus sp. ARC_14]MCH1884305.1 hypothetical protein [Agrococcus sp. ARC_14]